MFNLHKPFSGKDEQAATAVAAVSYLHIPEGVDISAATLVTAYFDRVSDAERFMHRYYASPHIPILEWNNAPPQPLFPFNVELMKHDEYENPVFGYDRIVTSIVHNNRQMLDEMYGTISFTGGRGDKRSFTYYEASGRIFDSETIQITFYGIESSVHGGRGEVIAEHKFERVGHLLVGPINAQKLERATNMVTTHLHWLGEVDKRRKVRELVLGTISSIETNRVNNHEQESKATTPP